MQRFGLQLSDPNPIGPVRSWSALQYGFINAAVLPQPPGSSAPSVPEIPVTQLHQFGFPVAEQCTTRMGTKVSHQEGSIRCGHISLCATPYVQAASCSMDSYEAISTCHTVRLDHMDERVFVPPLQLLLNCRANVNYLVVRLGLILAHTALMLLHSDGNHLRQSANPNCHTIWHFILSLPERESAFKLIKTFSPCCTTAVH